MHSESFLFSEADRRFVTESIGREPTGIVGVAARDPRCMPAVIIDLPLIRRGERWLPFPTLYWLVDPRLNKQIAEAERKGGVGQIEAALKADEELMQAHLADNRLYARSRWAVLNEKEEQIAKEQGFEDVLHCSGVGGVANHASIKCLHAQYAFHLARREAGTTAGRLIEKHFDLPRGE